MSLRFIYILIFAIAWGFDYAQPYSSKLGGFSVSEKQGCAPLTINIVELKYAGFCTCNYKVGTTSINSTHTFNQPGIYTITGNAQAGSPVGTDDMTIVVTANVQPEFEVSSCSAGKVFIKVIDTHYQQYLVDFTSDNISDNTIAAGGAQSSIHNYGLVGLRAISVRGKDLNSADNCNVQTKSFNTLAALPPATISTLTVVDASSIKLDYTPAVNVQYRAQIATDNATSFQQFQTFNSASSAAQSVTQNSLATDDKYYCFRINAFDPCNNTNVPSNTICSADLNLIVESAVNKLSWPTSVAGVSNFTIKRNKANYLIVGGTSFDDINIVCNTDYSYSIITNYANGSTSISSEKSGKSFTSKIPSSIENTSALVNTNGADLKWAQDPLFKAKSYSVKRSASNGAFIALGSVSATNFSDPSYLTSANYCYAINYLDICENQSPDGSIICPVQLTGSVNKNNTVSLNWSAYLGWKNGVKGYQIDKFNKQGTLLKTFDAGSLLSFPDDEIDSENQIVEYIIRAEPKDLLLESISNRIVIIKEAKLVFPTAFTPNKDGLNDDFTVIGQYVEKMTLQIFDRWGTLLFSTTNNEPWDGTNNGRAMPESTYIWKAFITDKTGKAFTNIGSVALLKK